MELSEKITALEAEKKQYITMIDSLNAEKIALDQMYVNSIKELLNVKKDLILSNHQLSEFQKLNNNLFKEKEIIQKELDKLKAERIEEAKVSMENML